jgi:ATP-dependent DNA ligase
VPSNQNQQVVLSSEWLREIKHDGFRIIARKKGARRALEL